MRLCFISFKKKKMTKSSAAFLVIFWVVLSVIVGAISGAVREAITVAATGEQNGYRAVIIDAGHGGEDCGAIGNTGVYEKTLNLEISLQIGELLEKAGYTVIYTRTEDKMLYTPEENIKGIRKISDLKNRCKIAENNPEAIFVSIHMNSFGDARYSGLQVYYSDNNETSDILADKIQTSVKDGLQPENKRRIKAGRDIYLLEHIAIPAVLVECGFLTNRTECEKLSEKEYQKELCFSIVCGIIEYINYSYKE